MRMRNGRLVSERVTAFLMAAMMLFLSAGEGISAKAAPNDNSGYYVEAIDINNQPQQTLYLLEGETLDIRRTRVPDGYEYSTQKPFEVSLTEGGAADQSVIEAKTTQVGSNIEASITAAKGKHPGQTALTSYNLTPVFRAYFKRSSTATVDFDTVNTDGNLVHISKNITANVLGTDGTASGLEILNEGILEFEVLEVGSPAAPGAPENPDEGVIQSLGTVTAQGDLKTAGFDGVQPSWDNVSRNSITVSMSNMSGTNQSLTLQITLPGDKLTKGAKFRITFRKETVRGITMAIVDRQNAVNMISTEQIQRTPTDYILLKPTDADLAHIVNNFELRHKDFSYNYKEGFNIEWVWVPDDPNDANSLEILNKNPNQEKWAVTVTQKMENVSGKLRATVKYEKGKGTASAEPVYTALPVEIPIIILGTGKSPSRTPVEQKVGTGNWTSVTEFPPQMDVYDGTHPNWPIKPTLPYTFRGKLNFGEGTSKAYTAKITVGDNDSGEVEVFVNNSTTPYVFGSEIRNPNTDVDDEQLVTFEVKAKELGSVRLMVTFYDRNGNEIVNPPQQPININITADSSPSPDWSLKALDLYGNFVSEKDSGLDKESYQDLQTRFEKAYPGGQVEYGFQPGPEKPTEFTIPLPWVIDKVNLGLLYNKTPLAETTSQRAVTVRWTDDKGTAQERKYELSPDGSKAIMDEWIPINYEQTKDITVSTLADNGDGGTYKFSITREPQGSNGFLELLEATRAGGETALPWLDGVEQPADQPLDLELVRNITYHIPYAERDKKFTLKATAADDWGRKPQFEVVDQDIDAPLNTLRRLLNSQTRVIYPRYRWNRDTGEINNINRVDVYSTSADGKTTIIYHVTVIVDDPDPDNTLADLRVVNPVDDSVYEFIEGAYAADRISRSYSMKLPYSTEKIQLEALPNSGKAIQVEVMKYSTDTDQPLWKNAKSKVVRDNATYLEFADDVSPSDPVTDDEMNFYYDIRVQAENEEYSSPSYRVYVERSIPNKNTDVTITVNNAADDSNLWTGQSTAGDNGEFTIRVPYDVQEVKVSAIAKYPDVTTVEINGRPVAVDSFRQITLDIGENLITVEVIPESGRTELRQILLYIIREKPSSEARLYPITGLEVSGAESMDPVNLIPDITNYTVVIPQGTRDFTIKAIPLDPHASVEMEYDGIQQTLGVGGGTSQPIVTTKGVTRVRITVTAQDGRTKKTYTVTIRDYNFLKKSSDATLSDLYVNYGDLSPDFLPNVEEYELYIKPNEMKLSLTPTLSDSRATMVVKMDSKVLSAYNGAYSNSILADQTVFTIEVTAEDGTKKTYTLNVYRNDEEKQGNLKPIKADMIDFDTSNPIYVDITQYALIDAEVFKKMKEEYPDKTIVFQGNDYALEIKGSEIDGLTPHVETYDLRFCFATPDEALIQDAMMRGGEDPDIDPVYLYFNDHGALPGRMKLTINLGREYRNQQLFWNYYNDERDRIDYYGYVNSNAKGTFSVPITHFSTYFVTDSKLISAENKAGVNYDGTMANGLGESSDNRNPGDINGGSSSGGRKPNPQTGVYAEIR